MNGSFGTKDIVHVEAASAWVDLVFHVLAHLRVSGPSSSFDPRYLQWVHAAAPRESWAPIAEDSATLEALYDATPDATLLHAFARFHTDVRAFMRSAKITVAEMADDDPLCADRKLLRHLRHLDAGLVEIFRADLALCARDYESFHAEHIAPVVAAQAFAVDAAVHDVAVFVPELMGHRIELVHALGPRGRGLGARILVGVPTTWNDLSSTVPAIVASHEALVMHAERTPDERAGASRPSYFDSEWRALVRGARAFAEAGGGLAAAHARWLGELDLADLVAVAVTRGWVEPGAADALDREPARRASVFATLGRDG